MIFTETKLAGAYIIEIEKHGDERGFFARLWCQNEFADHGLAMNWVQANLSLSEKSGTLRGLHYQVAPHQEAKLMRCIRGGIYDAIVDLRPDSPTYKQWVSVELTAENRKALYIPEGFAHGYQTLVNNTEVLYPVSQFYAPGAERGIRWNDPTFAIEWPTTETITLSDKDKSWPDFSL
jgi:dTDP-4-dehydrorhamnose 3,5-epimerase